MTNDLPSLAPPEALANALAAIPAELVTQTLVEGMRATTTNRAGVVEADMRTRIAAAGMVMDRVLGKPIERQQIITASVGPTDSDLIERLAHSPALRQAIREAVEAAENRLPTGG